VPVRTPRRGDYEDLASEHGNLVAGIRIIAHEHGGRYFCTYTFESDPDLLPEEERAGMVDVLMRCLEGVRDHRRFRDGVACRIEFQSNEEDPTTRN
jgi:hypothetical protein